MDGEEGSLFALCDGETRRAVRRRPGPQARLRRRHRAPTPAAWAAYSPAPDLHARPGRGRPRPHRRADGARHGAPRARPTRRALRRADGRRTTGRRVVEFNARFGDPGMPGADDAAGRRTSCPTCCGCARGDLARMSEPDVARRDGDLRGAGGARLSRQPAGRLDHPRRRSRTSAATCRSSTPAPPRKTDGQLAAAGGRVLNVCARGRGHRRGARAGLCRGRARSTGRAASTAPTSAGGRWSGVRAVPFYRFMIQGLDPRVPEEKRGFFTTRHAFGSNQDLAASRVLARLAREFTSGASADIWTSDAPIMTVEKAWRIGLHELFAAPNRGSTFYDERED